MAAAQPRRTAEDQSRRPEAQIQSGSQGSVTSMPNSALDREAIEAEIDRVRSLGLDELRTLWRATFRSPPPPAFAKDLIARFLCWHIQEQAVGELDAETANHLDGLVRRDKAEANRPGDAAFKDIVANRALTVLRRLAKRGTLVKHGTSRSAHWALNGQYISLRKKSVPSSFQWR